MLASSTSEIVVPGNYWHNCGRSLVFDPVVWMLVDGVYGLGITIGVAIVIPYWDMIDLPISGLLMIHLFNLLRIPWLFVGGFILWDSSNLLSSCGSADINHAVLAFIGIDCACIALSEIELFRRNGVLFYR